MDRLRISLNAAVSETRSLGHSQQASGLGEKKTEVLTICGTNVFPTEFRMT